jgi:hypothetical protein
MINFGMVTEALTVGLVGETVTGINETIITISVEGMHGLAPLALMERPAGGAG